MLLGRQLHISFIRVHSGGLCPSKNEQKPEERVIACRVRCWLNWSGHQASSLLDQAKDVPDSHCWIAWSSEAVDSLDYSSEGGAGASTVLDLPTQRGQLLTEPERKDLSGASAAQDLPR